MRKILILLLAALALLALTACGGDGDTSVTTPADTVAQTTPPPSEPLKIVDGGTTKFRIVYPDEPGSDLFSAVRNLAKEIQQLTGAELEYKSDFLKYDETHDDAAYEILVGNTNYTQSAEVLADLKTSDYAIVQRGNKIVVAAHNDDMIARAINYMRKNLLPDNLTKDESGKATIVFKEYTYIAEAPFTSFTIAGKELRGFKIVYAKGAEKYDRAAEMLGELIADRYGYPLEVVADTKCDPSPLEILVGPTNRPESADFAAKHPTEVLSFNMGVQGGKFVICGRPYSCLQAAQRFSTKYLYSGQKTLDLPEGEHFTASYLNRDSVPLAEGADVRIMTANILAEFKSWSNTYEITPVDERIEIFQALLEVYQPDVAGIQEVTDRWGVLIPKYLGERYELIYQKTPDGLVNYSTMIYDKTKYDVLDSGIKYFSTEGKNNIRLVTWAVFSAKGSDLKFSVFNTHWCWDTEEHAKQQALEESQLIAEVVKKYPYPVFCTADYNSKQDSANYKYFLELTGFVDAKYVAKDAGTLINVAGGCGSLGDTRPESGNSIDHVIMSPGYKVLGFATVVDNCTWDLSDHSPKYADVKLK